MADTGLKKESRKTMKFDTPQFRVYFPVKYIFVLFFIIMALFPIAIVLLNSFKTNIEINRITFLPQSLQVINYINVLSKPDFYISFLNTAFYVTAATILSVFITSLAGYAIGRRREKAFRFIFFFFLLSMMIPMGASLSALYRIVMTFNLVNTRAVIILLYTTGTIPMGILLFSGFMKTIPRELDEAAWIDGLSFFKCFYYVILPLLKPVIIAFVALTSIGMWNNFFTSLLFLRDKNKFPLPMLVYAFSSKTQTEYGSIYALMCLSFLPTITFFLFNQKYFYNGMVTGSLKA